MIHHPFTHTLALLALLAANTSAGDLTLAPKPFTVTSEFDCLAIPTGAEAIAIDANKWSDFTIETLLDHGSAVEKDEVLVKFKSKTLTHALEDHGRAVKTAKLALDDANSALAAAQAELPVNLAAARSTYQRVADDLERFTKINRPAHEEDAKQDLEISSFRLKSAKEELNQLLKMYAADDLTEETEEFILERQRKSVEMAEFSLKKQQLAADHTLKVSLPRQAEDYERSLKQAKITLDRAEAELPRVLDRAKIAATAATAAHQRATAELKDLQADSAKLTLKAPIGGCFYHGVFRDGKWVTGDLV